MRGLQRGVLAGLLIVAFGVEAEALVPQAQSRIASVERSYYGDWCDYVGPPPPWPIACDTADCGPRTDDVLEEETASGFEPFDVSVSLEGPTSTGGGGYVQPGHGNAGQTSTIEPNRIVASGHYSALGGYGSDWDECDNGWEISSEFEGDSWFSVSFELATDEPYALTGTLSGGADLFWGGDSVSIFARLTGPGGTVAEASCVVPSEGGGCGPVSLDEGGVLPPGLYTLEARATGSATGDTWGGPPGGSNNGNFDIALTLSQPPLPPLPALSARGLALLVTLIAAVGARWASR